MAGDVEEAKALFEKGQATAKSGRIAEACTLYEQSHKLAPNACGVLVNLAECTEAIGHSPEAYAYYDELGRCAEKQKQAERLALAKERGVALRRQLVQFDLSAYVSSTASRIRIDGSEIARDAWGRSIFVSAKPHSITIESDGCAPVTRNFDKLQGGGTLVVPAWSANCTATRPPSDVASRPAVTPPQTSTSDGSGWRTAGLITGGVGIVSLGVAGVGILTSLDKTSEEKKRVSATYDAFAVTGLALVGAGAVMYFVLGKDSRPQQSYLVPAVGPQMLGFQAGTSW